MTDSAALPFRRRLAIAWRTRRMRQLQRQLQRGQQQLNQLELAQQRDGLSLELDEVLGATLPGRLWQALLAPLRRLPGLGRLPSGALSLLLVLLLGGLGTGGTLLWQNRPAPVIRVPLPEPEAAVLTPEPENALLPEPEPAPPVAAPKPKPTAVPEPPPEPVPQLVLSPQEQLIEGIEARLRQVSDRTAASLLQSVRASFRTGRLTLQLDSAWSGLEPEQQQALADDLWQAAREMGFRRLELVDTNDGAIARSPVVGRSMLILSAGNS